MLDYDRLPTTILFGDDDALMLLLFESTPEAFVDVEASGDEIPIVEAVVVTEDLGGKRNTFPTNPVVDGDGTPPKRAAAAVR